MEEEDSKFFSISDKPEKIVFSSQVPSYHVDHVYKIDASSDSEDKPKPAKTNRNVCWNCGDAGHAIRQCTLPHNPREINKNRSLFATRNEFKRYHVDLKGEMYPNVKPGMISSKLREALGLNEDQLPLYIYRMRTLGYPPGWLLEARNDVSGIEMFDMEGNRVPNADEEEGEIGITTSIYNEAKIIAYPGFNEWPHPGTLDETKRYDAPPLQSLQSREEFIRLLKEAKTTTVESYECIKPRPMPDVAAGVCDMETDDTEELKMLPEDGREVFIPPLPDESDTPPLPPPEDGEVPDDGIEDTGEDSGSSPSPTVLAENMLSNLDDSSHGRVMSIELGTPMLKIHSPFNKLPPPEAFQKDISDVINFENLPDSTGAYEKLKGVLSNVKKRMSLIRGTKLNATL